MKLYTLSPIAQHRIPRSRHLVKPPHRSAVRRVMEECRVGLRFLGDLQHRIDEAVQRFLALGFGRLDHQRLGDY